MKPGSKYHPLYQKLAECQADRVTIAIDDLEACIDGQFPATARTRGSWWSNRSKGGHQSRAWIDAGYHTDGIDFEQQTVTFQKFQAEYRIRRVDGDIQWDQNAIRALRKHMNLTQSRFAETMGVRRQTVSEWENGLYEPDRSTLKHLSLLAQTEAFAAPDSDRLPETSPEY